jgi:hypothetical protein
MVRGRSAAAIYIRSLSIVYIAHAQPQQAVKSKLTVGSLTSVKEA